MTVKKLIAGLFVAAVVSLGVSGSVHATTDPVSEITGVITENNAAVAGAEVTVTCNGHVRTDTSDTWGSYRVSFLKGECDFGATAKVVATKDGKSGVANGMLQGITTKLNLAIVNVSVPEFGTLGLIAAGGMGLGFMAYMRRKQQAQL